MRLDWLLMYFPTERVSATVRQWAARARAAAERVRAAALRWLKRLQPTIVFKRLPSGIALPGPAFQLDRFFLRAAAPGSLAPGETIEISCGMAVLLPRRYAGLLCTPHKLARSWSVRVLNPLAPANGELRVVLRNEGKAMFFWAYGDVIAEMILQKQPYLNVQYGV